MKNYIIFVTTVSMGLMMGSPAIAGSSDRSDYSRGAEWDPDRAISQNLPSPRYRSFDDHNRYWESRQREEYTGPYYDERDDQNGYERNQQQYDRYYSDRNRTRQNHMAHTVMGTLLRRQENEYLLNTVDGNRIRLRVDDRTLLDAGIERGDRVIAKMKANGHAIALRKDRGRKGGPYTR
ncbi:MAG: hypothetical protein NPIRA01_01880 [Nitrospirales bacterium]|nr:MAG: hypothetical protein NPIRA01_01880 [Nitrospirales bacterium]